MTSGYWRIVREIRTRLEPRCMLHTSLVYSMYARQVCRNSFGFPWKRLIDPLHDHCNRDHPQLSGYLIRKYQMLLKRTDQRSIYRCVESALASFEISQEAIDPSHFPLWVLRSQLYSRCFNVSFDCVIERDMTLFRSIAVFCGPDSIPRNILHVQFHCGEYSVEYSQAHRTLLWI